MTDTLSLTNDFLIAMPSLNDPNFYHSVTYICEHNAEGAMGIIINRPLDVSLGEVLEHMELEASTPEIAEQVVYLGGPVQKERGFVIHRQRGNWETEVFFGEGIGITTSNDILAAISKGRGPEDCFIALGFASWEPGQLEQEILDNSWINVPANKEIIFSTPCHERWNAAAKLVGIDLQKLSTTVGRS